MLYADVLKFRKSIEIVLSADVLRSKKSILAKAFGRRTCRRIKAIFLHFFQVHIVHLGTDLTCRQGSCRKGHGDLAVTDTYIGMEPDTSFTCQRSRLSQQVRLSRLVLCVSVTFSTSVGEL